jgi:hypothetical protein
MQPGYVNPSSFTKYTNAANAQIGHHLSFPPHSQIVVPSFTKCTNADRFSSSQFNYKRLMHKCCRVCHSLFIYKCASCTNAALVPMHKWGRSLLIYNLSFPSSLTNATTNAQCVDKSPHHKLQIFIPSSFTKLAAIVIPCMIVQVHGSLLKKHGHTIQLKAFNHNRRVKSFQHK